MLRSNYFEEINRIDEKTVKNSLRTMGIEYKIYLFIPLFNYS